MILNIYIPILSQKSSLKQEIHLKDVIGEF